jgi:hypothetical protein
MDKLSGILPSNARIKSVDLKDAKPRRPGAPSLGVPMGTTSVKDRVNLNAGIQNPAEDLLVYKNPKEMRHAKIAEETTKKFFETRLQNEPKVTEVVEENINQSIEQLPELEELQVSEPQLYTLKSE